MGAIRKAQKSRYHCHTQPQRRIVSNHAAEWDVCKIYESSTLRYSHKNLPVDFVE